MNIKIVITINWAFEKTSISTVDMLDTVVAETDVKNKSMFLGLNEVKGLFNQKSTIDDWRGLNWTLLLSSYQESEHDHPNRAAETSRQALENQEPHAPLCTLSFRRTLRSEPAHTARLNRNLRGTGAPPVRHPYPVPEPPGLRGPPPRGGGRVRVPDRRRSGPAVRPGFFKDILGFLEEDEEKYRGLGLDEFLKMVADVGYNEQSFCKDSSSSCHVFSPLLQKTRV
ncbi:hypothetical protein BUALT_Bualt11G0077000 [Buddleja alternifolia]|uniref:Uncharacterized protein n=1 Tax=Buddleja alternifolia TaxID=168488 RepID=A0AAV6X0K5_9LAMI|nr:hypothetical protein BUALT_Bualt11G0077000 [Buddleja alternifolia]